MKAANKGLLFSMCRGSFMCNLSHFGLELREIRNLIGKMSFADKRAWSNRKMAMFEGF